jgi:hypothetical protein
MYMYINQILPFTFSSNYLISVAHSGIINLGSFFFFFFRLFKANYKGSIGYTYLYFHLIKIPSRLQDQ